MTTSSEPTRSSAQTGGTLVGGYGNTVDSDVETVFTDAMPNHTTHTDYLPHFDRWFPACDQCGRIGGASFEEQADAAAIANRHAEVGGFEAIR